MTMGLNLLERNHCEVCGNPDTEEHHPDHNKPELVIWLCKYHHEQAHKEIDSTRN